MLMVVKAVASGLFIVAINAIAQRNASLGGWIASLPLVTVLSVGWLSFDQRADAAELEMAPQAPPGPRRDRGWALALDARPDFSRETLEDVQHLWDRSHREVEHEMLDARGHVRAQVLDDLSRRP